MRESITNKRTYKEYEVLSNTSLCKLVHLLVLRAKDSLELIPIGRHVEVKMNVMGEYKINKIKNFLDVCIYFLFTETYI